MKNMNVPENTEKSTALREKYPEVAEDLGKIATAVGLDEPFAQRFVDRALDIVDQMSAEDTGDENLPHKPTSSLDLIEGNN